MEAMVVMVQESEAGLRLEELEADLCLEYQYVVMSMK